MRVLSTTHMRKRAEMIIQTYKYIAITVAAVIGHNKNLICTTSAFELTSLLREPSEKRISRTSCPQPTSRPVQVSAG